MIWLGVWVKSVSAIAFYTKWGFKKVGRKEFVLDSDIQRDFIMERHVNLQPNHSLEATWDAAKFAIDGADLISWRAGVGECPGASARNR